MLDSHRLAARGSVALPAPEGALRLGASAAAPRLRVAIAGGGTGGHLVPGIALARELAQGEDGADIVFFTSGKAIEHQIVDAARFERIDLPARPLPRSLLAVPGAIFAGVRSLVAAWRALSAVRPDVMVGLGGFAAAAPALVARLRGVPLILLEQNAIPGRTNRWLASVASQIHLQWAVARERLGSGASRAIDSGSPLRDGVLEAAGRHRRSAQAMKRFGVAADSIVILVTGGSQGAQALNTLAVAATRELPAALAARLHFLHLAGGAASIDELEEGYARSGVVATVLSFLDDMPAAYAICDLALARAGGSTLAEFAAAGIPSILVPYPHAADRHQHANAEAVQSAGAGVVLDESGVAPARLAREIERIVCDARLLHSMSSAARSLSRPDAAASIAASVRELVRGRP